MSQESAAILREGVLLAGDLMRDPALPVEFRTRLDEWALRACEALDSVYAERDRLRACEALDSMEGE